MQNITSKNIHYQAHSRFFYEMSVDGMGDVGVAKKILDTHGNLYEFHFEPYRRFGMEPCHAKTMEALKAQIAE